MPVRTPAHAQACVIRGYDDRRIPMRARIVNVLIDDAGAGTAIGGERKRTRLPASPGRSGVGSRPLIRPGLYAQWNVGAADFSAVNQL